jgi:hypothetical protein
MELEDENGVVTELRPRFSRETAVNPRGYILRAIENYSSDGRVDPSRSHYTINGRKTTRGRYKRALWLQ